MEICNTNRLIKSLKIPPLFNWKFLGGLKKLNKGNEPMIKEMKNKELVKFLKKLTKKQLIKELKLVDKKIANLGIRRYASWDLNTEENKLIDKRFFLNTELKKRK